MSRPGDDVAGLELIAPLTVRYCNELPPLVEMPTGVEPVDKPALVKFGPLDHSTLGKLEGPLARVYLAGIASKTHHSILSTTRHTIKMSVWQRGDLAECPRSS